jgi:hypothetical protein
MKSEKMWNVGGVCGEEMEVVISVGAIEGVKRACWVGLSWC